ncbi:MAG: hypothetical protein HXY25_03615, partial [Alphaproteobacteria bacterium]|nr:hypothetical protein [Alphaproteobacteria bacterium]
MTSLDNGQNHGSQGYASGADDFDDFGTYARRGSRRSRMPWLGLIAMIILVLFGGAIWVAFQQGMEYAKREGPPVVAGLEEPVRVRPDDPGGLEPPPERRVYDVAAGTAESSPSVETLLPREDEGLDLEPAGSQTGGPSSTVPTREVPTELRSTAQGSTDLAQLDPGAGAGTAIPIPPPSAALVTGERQAEAEAPAAAS